MNRYYKKALKALTICILPISSLSLIAFSSCATNPVIPPTPSPTKQLFEVENNILKGFNPTLTEEQVVQLIGGDILVIPSNVRFIANDAFFRNNKSTIPASVTQIDFNRCANLSSIGDNAFRESPLKRIHIPMINYIGESAFAYSSLEQVVILGDQSSNKKIDIRKFAFSRNSSLQQITLCNNILNIGDEAFSENPKVSKIDCSSIDAIPDSWTGTKTFNNTGMSNCGVIEYSEITHNALKPYFLNNGLNETANFTPINRYFNIKYNATENEADLLGFQSYVKAEQLSKITNGVLYIPTLVTSIAKKAFWVDDKTTIPDSFTKIDFSGAESLRDIGYDAFRGCDSIKTIFTPPNFPILTRNLFSNYSNLEEVHLHHDIIKIENSPFKNCPNLKQIFYDGSISRCMAIERETGWASDTQLQNIKCPHQGTTKLDECGLDEQYTPSYSFIWSLPTAEDTISISKYFHSSRTSTSLFIPAYYLKLENNKIHEYKVIRIDSHAFDIDNITEVISIPENIESIDSEAFTQLERLDKVYLPKSLLRIEQRGFSDCEKLENITYAGTVDDWKNIYLSNEWHHNIKATYVFCVESGKSAPLDP